MPGRQKALNYSYIITFIQPKEESRRPKTPCKIAAVDYLERHIHAYVPARPSDFEEIAERSISGTCSTWGFYGYPYSPR
jgi:hypothetical protein